jgi:DNA-binding PadR family transcriptional regulator
VEAILSARAAVLLGLRRGPACGLVLIERIVGQSAGTVRPAEGSVYPVLGGLEEKGLVRRLAPRPKRGRGRAQVDYELTVAGVAASDGLRAALRPMVQAGALHPDGDALDEGMHARILASLALSRFAAVLRNRLRQGPRP